MSLKLHDIGDDEIRIISPLPDGSSRKRPVVRNSVLVAVSVVIVILIAAVLIVNVSREKNDDTAYFTSDPIEPVTETVVPDVASRVVKGFIAERDTTVNGAGLKILMPENCIATLEIGDDVVDDSTAILVAPAADVMGSDGRIVGTYVVKGVLVSKGESKSGFCSIVDGNISIGVADATPMLEHALESDGYFFRQYPLVVGGQIVENKPKGRAMRKALAEIDGKICVVLSEKRLTFHDFSQALIDAGARNAIYLVGSDAAGFYIAPDGTKVYFGSQENHLPGNYIVWR